ncbi:MAG: hypothetical protein HC914_20810 [Chloroflexaceae bacterium]|nr:hypothetical protein [Chloroflexaceae bacterium]
MLLAAGISTAVPPLLLLLSNLVGVPWNSITLSLYLLASLLITIYPTHPDGSLYRQQGRGVRWPWQGTVLDGATLMLVLLALVALLVRLYVVRDLPTGLFGDSYHHTLIAQLLVDNSGLFHSWQPYAPLVTMTYHYGFHANAAFVHWLTGLDVPRSVLLVGQLHNTIAVLLPFVLVVVLGARPWAGVWAVLLAGFVLLIPAFFVNWGRYTQLTGQVMLAAGVVVWVVLAECTLHDSASPVLHWRTALLAALRHRWRLLLLAALLTAALMLTHYRVTVFAAAFVGSYLLAALLVQRSGWAMLLLALRSAGAALLALVLALPWLLNVVQSRLLSNMVSFVGGMDTARVEQTVQLPAVHPLYLDRLVIALAVGGLLVAGWQRQWRVAMLAGWAVLLAVCLVPRVVGLPGTGAIDYLTAFGTLYLVAAPLAGYALERVQAGLAALPCRRW